MAFQTNIRRLPGMWYLRQSLCSSVSMDLKGQREGADGNGPDGGLPQSAS